MSSRIDNTYTTYYLTALESKMWTDFDERYAALAYQAPEHRNLVENGNGEAEPNDMNANPYRRYIYKHQLPTGTLLVPTSSLKFNTILLLTGVIKPLKHCAGAVERTARCFSSIVLGIFSLTGQILHLKALCPTRFVVTCLNLKSAIGSPLENLKFACHHLCLGFIFGIATPHFIYENWNNVHSNNWAEDGRKELEKMNGTYVSLSDMYNASREIRSCNEGNDQVQ